MDSLEQVILDVSDYSQITNFPEGWRKKLAEAIKVWIKEKRPPGKELLIFSGKPKNSRFNREAEGHNSALKLWSEEMGI